MQISEVTIWALAFRRRLGLQIRAKEAQERQRETLSLAAPSLLWQKKSSRSSDAR